MNIQINEDSKVSVNAQIVRQVMLLVLSDALNELNKVTSVRDLAAELSIATGTVSKAYSELIDYDVLYSRKGKGVFVKEGAYENARSVMNEFFEDSLELLLREMVAGGFSPRDIFKKLEDNIDYEAPIYGDKYNG
jgi:GntR family transcriptional regulator